MKKEETRQETRPKTRPGKNGGTLNNGRDVAGPGRPSRKPYKEALMKALQEDPKALERIVKAQLKAAATAKGHLDRKELADRSDGKATIELTGLDGKDLIPDKIVVSWH